VALTVGFPDQGKGKLFRKSEIKELEALNEQEIKEIENKFQEIFNYFSNYSTSI
jgi:hypothetical protein